MIRYAIEMLIPDSVDSSALLERLQALAAELLEECEDEDGGDACGECGARFSNDCSIVNRAHSDACSLHADNVMDAVSVRMVTP